MSTQAAEPVQVRLRALAKGPASKKPLWKEKWSVSLSGNEEFHITDRLLKLSNASDSKTLYVLKVIENELSWEQVDTSTDVEVNGEMIKMGRLKMGDRFVIRAEAGKSFDIEVVEAPVVEEAGPVVKAHDSSEEKTVLDIPPLSTMPDSEPTLTITQVAKKNVTDGPSFTSGKIREVVAGKKDISQVIELEQDPVLIHSSVKQLVTGDPEDETKPWMPEIDALGFRIPLGVWIFVIALVLASGAFLGVRWYSERLQLPVVVGGGSSEPSPQVNTQSEQPSVDQMPKVNVQALKEKPIVRETQKLVEKVNEQVKAQIKAGVKNQIQNVTHAEFSKAPEKQTAPSPVTQSSGIQIGPFNSGIPIQKVIKTVEKIK